MTLEEQSRLSFYRKIAEINDHKNVELVQHIENSRVYVKKIQTVYDRRVYEILCRLQDPFFPKIEECVEDSGKLILVESYITGETLQEILNRGQTFSLEQTADFMIQICDGLRILHDQTPPIVHRDIKPSNLILTESGKLKMIDCNTARQFEETKTTDTILMGTQGFAAPEQYGFRQTDPRTDIYSMGVLAHLLLTGHMPGEGAYEGSASSIIRKCMEMEPANRYANVKQLRQAWQKISAKKTPKNKDKKAENSADETPMNRNKKAQTSTEETPTNGGKKAENSADETPTNRDKKTENSADEIHNKISRKKSGNPNRLPGFRTGSLWKMAIAVLGYYLMLRLPFEMEFTTEGIPLSGYDLWINRIGVFLFEFICVLLWGNYKGIQEKLPLMRRQRWLKWIMLILYSILTFVIMASLCAILEQI